MASGDSIRFFAWLMRDSAARGARKLSSICCSRRICFTAGQLVGRVVDDEVARQADVRRLAAEQPGAQGVEGRDPQAAVAGAEQRADALAHLLGGLVGEGDRQHLARAREAAADQVRDAVRDDAGLAGPRAREDQQGPVGVSTASRCSGLRESGSPCGTEAESEARSRRRLSADSLGRLRSQ